MVSGSCVRAPCVTGKTNLGCPFQVKSGSFCSGIICRYYREGEILVRLSSDSCQRTLVWHDCVACDVESRKSLFIKKQPWHPNSCIEGIKPNHKQPIVSINYECRESRKDQSHPIKLFGNLLKPHCRAISGAGAAATRQGERVRDSKSAEEIISLNLALPLLTRPHSLFFCVTFKVIAGYCELKVGWHAKTA